LFLIFGYYTFSSKLKSQYLLKKNQFTSDDKYLAVITENGLWIRDEVNGTINIINADKISSNLLINVSIVQFDKDFKLLQVIRSKEVNIKSKKWIISNPFITKKNSTNKSESINLNSNFDMEIINNLFSNLSSMSLIQLRKLKKNYSKLGYSTVGIKVYENKIYSVPIYLAIMTLLSGIIMFNSKYKKNKIFNVILGISLSVVIYYVNYFSGLLGETRKIPIILSVWLPLIVLTLISSIGLVRLNEK
jgi:lipopolysaccharide export system permease protein